MTAATGGAGSPLPLPVRVMIADDDSSIRAALVDLISDDPSLLFVGAAVDTDTAVAMALATQPDVAVLDVRMPGAGGVHAAGELRRLCPRTIVIGLSSHGDRGTTDAMLGAGACRMLIKGASDTDLLIAIAELIADNGSASIVK